MLNRPFDGIARHLVSCLLASLLCTALDAAPSWRPITDEDQNIETSGVDTSAGAIVLLREISVDDSDLGGTEIDYYIRVKVLSEKGVEALNKTEIPFTRDRSIRGLAARVVKADGTSIEVEKKAFFTREIIKTGNQTISVKAFSFAGLEPGCIAEYRYRVRSSDALGGMRITLDDVLPVALIRIRVRPFNYPGLWIQTIWSNDSLLKNKGRDRKSYYVFEGTNIPVVPAEPLAPPDDVAHPWFAFYFTLGLPELFWNYTGGELAAAGQVLLKPTKRLKEAAAKITAGAQRDSEKLEKLYEFCRTQIKNLSYDACGYSADEIAELKLPKTPDDVLTLGYGTGAQINLLFAALLRAQNGVCSLVYCNDRSQAFFDEQLTMRSTLPDLIVALKVGDWRFYDPGALYVPMGRLQWKNDGTMAMLIDGKLFWFITTPRSRADYSGIQRTGRFKLTADGALEGDVEIAFTGHESTTAKHLHDTRTAQESLDIVRKEFEKRLGSVEVSECVIHDARDPDKPLKITCHVRVRNYAETTGDRIFLQPAFFQKGVEPRLTSTKRESNIYFPYPTTEDDTVTIDLPHGFDYEVSTQPKALDQVESLTYRPRVRYAETPAQIAYQRTLTLDMFLVQRRAYEYLKASFDHIHAQDGYTVTLKRTSDPTGETAPQE